MDQQSILNKAILSVLKPLVRMLLRNNVPYGAFADLVRRAYIEVATKDFTVAGRKQSNSRIATITGLSRKEVKRIQELPPESDNFLIEKYNRAARVVYGWVHDKSYQEKDGRTCVLNFDGDAPSFTSLVKSYSGDVTPRAILDELVRVGVVELDDAQKIHLLSRAYIPKAGVNEKVRYIGTDVSALLNTMDRNIYQPDLPPFFQRKVYYDNLPDEVIEELQAMIAKNSQQLLEKVDQALEKFDRDSSPGVKGSGRNGVGVGVYYFENKDIKEHEDAS